MNSARLVEFASITHATHPQPHLYARSLCDKRMSHPAVMNSEEQMEVNDYGGVKQPVFGSQNSIRQTATSYSPDRICGQMNEQNRKSGYGGHNPDQLFLYHSTVRRNPSSNVTTGV
jgi:hypothetical protein